MTAAAEPTLLDDLPFPERFADEAALEDYLATPSRDLVADMARIEGDLLHNSMPHFESVIDKLDRYSTAGALALMNKGVKGSLGKALGHGWWAFMRTYFVKLGFLDGRLGLALAISNAEGTYYRYMKLWLLQRKSAAPSRD